MPRISAFYGIVIYMYRKDHPPPHFHATYAGEDAAVAISTLEVIDGRLSPRALRLVREWARQHEALLANFEHARTHAPLARIEPLK